MAELGIDLGGHRSKLYADVAAGDWGHFITVCDDANERCPWVPGSVQRLHWPFPDPSRASRTEEERLAVFRRVRDRIWQRLTDWLGGR
jgi:arsenate reductase